jgi:hypothetical protein
LVWLFLTGADLWWWCFLWWVWGAQAGDHNWQPLLLLVLSMGVATALRGWFWVASWASHCWVSALLLHVGVSPAYEPLVLVMPAPVGSA